MVFYNAILKLTLLDDFLIVDIDHYDTDAQYYRILVIRFLYIFILAIPLDMCISTYLLTNRIPVLMAYQWMLYIYVVVEFFMAGVMLLIFTACPIVNDGFILRYYFSYNSNRPLQLFSVFVLR